jgi:hypothetical protein
MKNQKYTSENKSLGLDEEIQFYINRKKDENSALKKLLQALENAKKSTIVPQRL